MKLSIYIITTELSNPLLLCRYGDILFILYVSAIDAKRQKVATSSIIGARFETLGRRERCSPVQTALWRLSRISTRPRSTTSDDESVPLPLLSYCVRQTDLLGDHSPP